MVLPDLRSRPATIVEQALALRPFLVMVRVMVSVVIVSVKVSVDSILYTTPQSSSPSPSSAGGNGSTSSTRRKPRKCGWAATSRRRHAEMEGRQEYAQTACNPHRHRRLPVGLSRASSHDRCQPHFPSLHSEA